MQGVCLNLLQSAGCCGFLFPTLYKWTTIKVTFSQLVDLQTRMEVGAVCDLRSIRDAISTARLVMQHTTHTTLVGLQASAFALEMGMKLSNLSTPASSQAYYKW